MTIREGGAIPQKQVVALLLALGRDAQVARLDGRLADVLNHSTFVVSAWDGAVLVGAARVISDGIAVALVQHLGVHPAYQGRGHCQVKPFGRRRRSESGERSAHRRPDPACTSASDGQNWLGVGRFRSVKT